MPRRQKLQLDVVLVEKLPQGSHGLLQQGNGICVILHGLTELGHLFVPQHQGLCHVFLGFLDLGLQHLNLIAEALLLVGQMLNALPSLVDGIVEVLHVVRVLAVRVLAPVAMLNVGLLLGTQDLHHLVDGHDHLVEVASGLDPRSELCEVEVVKAPGQTGQALVGLARPLGGRAVMSDRRQLHEGRRGVRKSLHSLRARQDLDGLAHALQLHDVQAAAVVPLRGLDLATILRLGEELLVGLELRLGVVLQLLALGELLQLRGVVGLLLRQGRLQGIEFLLLRRHEFLEGLLRIRLLGVCLLQVAGESLVHAFEDALDLGGLRGIIAEGIVAELRSA
mmetsp:Transcript_64279/g.162934  ORF Transcript_64279/g.162934 Transcript_64279/m.162934 type:complete len:336 (+) Transcript_64279:553-1560(+)